MRRMINEYTRVYIPHQKHLSVLQGSDTKLAFSLCTLSHVPYFTCFAAACLRAVFRDIYIHCITHNDDFSPPFFFFFSTLSLGEQSDNDQMGYNS